MAGPSRKKMIKALVDFAVIVEGKSKKQMRQDYEEMSPRYLKDEYVEMTSLMTDEIADED